MFLVVEEQEFTFLLKSAIMLTHEKFQNLDTIIYQCVRLSTSSTALISTTTTETKKLSPFHPKTATRRKKKNKK